MIIPSEVSGRKVTNRGVHLHPFGYHEVWLERANCWIDLLQSMNMSWCLILSESDSAYISGACETLLGGGIIPIIRFKYLFPDQWQHGWVLDLLAPLYYRYNAPLIVQFANEPFDIREWRGGKVPANAWDIIAQRWWHAANEITARGAIAGFPDGPCYSLNPFEIIGDDHHYWEDGKAVYLGHFYGLGRPLAYPQDGVSMYGTQLTMDQYRAELDDFCDDPAWNEGPSVLEMMNRQRREQANQNLTPCNDDTCWRGWEKVLQWSRDTFGFEVAIAMTEGGWTPRARAGSGPNLDIRWPYYTPKKVAQTTVEMYNHPSPLFAICPWLLASQDMGGIGWDDDCWVGYAFEDKYGREKPIIRALQESEPVVPGVRENIASAMSCLETALGLL